MMAYTTNLNLWNLSSWVIALALTVIIFREHRRSLPSFEFLHTLPARLEILAALLFIAVGLILRFAFLGEFFEGRLTGDESLTSVIYTSAVVHGEQARNGATHLAVALALDFWYQLFNFTPLAARAFSATLGAVSLVCFFLGLRRAAGTRLALWSTAFLSVSLYGIYFSKLALEIGWVLFIPPVVFFLVLSATPTRSVLLSASAGLVFSLGLFSYPGVLLATVSLMAGMAISYLAYGRNAEPSWWRSAGRWVMPLAFFGGSIPYTVYALYQHFAVLGVGGQALLAGGGALSFSMVSILSGWHQVLYDALISASSWYLIYPEMTFFETSLLPLGAYGIYMFWRNVTHTESGNRWLWRGIFLAIPICMAIVPFTGPYPGMRRALFVLLPYSVALGGGFIFLISAITAQRAVPTLAGSKHNPSLYKVTSLSILLLAGVHPIAYQFTTGRDIARVSFSEGYNRGQIPLSFILQTLKTHDIVLDRAEFDSGWFDGLIYTHYPRLYNRYNPEAGIRHKVHLVPYGELLKFSDKILMTWDSGKFDQLVAAGKVSVPPESMSSDNLSLPYWGILTLAAYNLVSDTAYNLTDRNWNGGVAVRWAGFFVDSTSANLAELTSGKKIRFADGSERTIVWQKQNGSYLYIGVSGLPLDGARVGYPNKFEVQK